MGSTAMDAAVAASLAPMAAGGWAAAMAPRAATVASPARPVVVAVAEVAGARGRVVMTQWATDGRIRGAPAASTRAGGGAGAEEEEQKAEAPPETPPEKEGEPAKAWPTG